MLTSMTPARSPNMNSGWPRCDQFLERLAEPGSARGEAAMTLKAPSVTASAKRPPMPPWSTVRSRMSRLARDGAGALVRQKHHGVDQLAGRQRQHRLGVALDVVVPVEQRQEADRRDDDQEDDDQRRDRTLEQRLGGEQAAIGGLGDERAHGRADRPSGRLCAGQKPTRRARATRPHSPLMAPLSPLPS